MQTASHLQKVVRSQIERAAHNINNIPVSTAKFIDDETEPGTYVIETETTATGGKGALEVINAQIVISFYPIYFFYSMCKIFYNIYFVSQFLFLLEDYKTAFPLIMW